MMPMTESTTTIDYITSNSIDTNVVMIVDQDIHNAYNMLNKLNLTKKEIEHYLVKFVQNTREEAKKSLNNLTKNHEQTIDSVALKKHYSAIINRCDEVLNDDKYIKSIVY